MGQRSAIEWTDHTFNPWWGCTKVSPGCKHCYAETLSIRHGHDVWGPGKSRRKFGDRHWQEPLNWNRQALKQNRRARVFCASMADVFEDNADLESERQRLWNLIAETQMLDWLLLTKRPENMLRFAPWGNPWPANVWAMVSVEDQEQAERRVPILLDVPAVVRGLSVEPLIAPVDLEPWLAHIHWVIVGGESGRSARPMHADWVRQLRQQCITANVAFFFKQWGEWAPTESELGHTRVQVAPGVNGKDDHFANRTGKKAAGRLLDGRIWDELPQVGESLL